MSIFSTISSWIMGKEKAPTWVTWVIVPCFALFSAFYFAEPINLTTADLGRHIKNGEVYFQLHAPITTNYYSYTFPDFPTVNHHWLTGPIFYSIWKESGFIGLSLVYILVCIAALFLFFWVGLKKAGLGVTLVVSLILLPLIASRREVRPEGFSLMFLGIFYAVLALDGVSKHFFRNIIILTVTQLLWVNTHIFFPFGPFLVGMFGLHAFLFDRDKHLLIRYGILLGIVSLSCLVNPFGLGGALVPLTIFHDYGYMLAENQSVFFMQNRFGSPIYLHYELLVLLTAALVILVVKYKRPISQFLITGLLTFIFGILGFKMIRNLPLFGLILLPFLADQIGWLSKVFGEKAQTRIMKWIAGTAVFLSLVGILFPNHYFSPFGTRAGIDVLPKIQASAEFFKKNHISGPIFNNYDIGGYLIFNLFPDWRVFVDNRPEAYTSEFFQKTYIPMQEDETKWQEMLDTYQFNVIYFYRHDFTPWAQPFLIKRVQDPQWAAIYVDDYTIILVRRNDANKEIIRKYELPKQMFGAR